jgi:hypothetical protein
MMMMMKKKKMMMMMMNVQERKKPKSPWDLSFSPKLHSPPTTRRGATRATTRATKTNQITVHSTSLNVLSLHKTFFGFLFLSHIPWPSHASPIPAHLMVSEAGFFNKKIINYFY